MKKVILVPLILFCILISPLYGAEAWHFVRTVGMYQYVVIDKSQWKDQNVYRQAVSKLCEGKDFCWVLFWKDRALVPHKIPMTEKQAKGMVADYSFNKSTGNNKFVWSCAIVNDPKQCFKP